MMHTLHLWQGLHAGDHFMFNQDLLYPPPHPPLFTHNVVPS